MLSRPHASQESAIASHSTHTNLSMQKVQSSCTLLGLSQAHCCHHQTRKREGGGCSKCVVSTLLSSTAEEGGRIASSSTAPEAVVIRKARLVYGDEPLIWCFRDDDGRGGSLRNGNLGIRNHRVPSGASCCRNLGIGTTRNPGRTSTRADCET